MIAPAPRSNVEELEPEVVKESWNVYQLDDGVRLLTRPILTKILWPKGREPIPGEVMQIEGRFANLVVIFAPEKLRGPPNPQPPSTGDFQKLKQEEVAIVDSKEEWNLYRLSGKKGGIKVKMIVSTVYRVVGVFDQMGDPYYLVNSTNVVGPTSPRDVAVP